MAKQLIEWLGKTGCDVRLLVFLSLMTSTWLNLNAATPSMLPTNSAQPLFTRIEARGADLWMEWTAVPEAAQGYIISWRAVGSEDWTDVACSADQHQFHIHLPSMDHVNNDLEVRIRSNVSFHRRSAWSKERVAIQAPKPVVDGAATTSQPFTFLTLLANLNYVSLQAL